MFRCCPPYSLGVLWISSTTKTHVTTESRRRSSQEKETLRREDFPRLTATPQWKARKLSGVMVDGGVAGSGAVGGFLGGTVELLCYRHARRQCRCHAAIDQDSERSPVQPVCYARLQQKSGDFPGAKCFLSPRFCANLSSSQCTLL